MVLSANLGFPRIGANRELKKAVEAYWKKTMSRQELEQEAKALRLRHWQLQAKAGINHIPSNDFSFYDQVLDMCATLGCVPARYGFRGGNVDLDLYFAMARGNDAAPAMEMTKWFDTNYHYMVPELEEGMDFALSSDKIFNEFEEAKAAGIKTRPVIIGPVTFLHLAKPRYEGFDPAAVMAKLMPVYVQILQKLAALGAEWVQIDEPYLAMDLCDEARAGFKPAYETLAKAAPSLKIMVATYFEALRENLSTATALPVAGLHVDLCRAPGQLGDVLAAVKKTGLVLSLGLVDGRNIWKTDLERAAAMAEKAVDALGKDRVMVAPSCSLLHSPVDLAAETRMKPEILGWLAFATQKLDEVAVLTTAADKGRDAVAAQMAASKASVAARKESALIHDKAVKARTAGITAAMSQRNSPFPARREAQVAAFDLPLYPTTTIGSFPQTAAIRKARADFKAGTIDAAAYEAAMKTEIKEVVKYQEDIDMDVLVHGEAERNDMVEYFGEQLSGFTFSSNGWVQSYGSRCVKPPIIFGDVSRPTPMTVKWSAYAQSLTPRPMKGMLTGPITILQWSFVRDDQPRSETCRQIALAIRDEVADLEKADIRIIQIDEPAIREGLPLRRADWDAYLEWAVEAFRLSCCCVEDSTQIHTHMCYSEFNDIITSIGAMDADVISIETSRSQMELLDAFVDYKYPNEIGPGVYDIHSPRIPSEEEMVDLLDKAVALIPAQQIWVNPDCGLKTRGWAEVRPALERMVKAAKTMRGKAKATRAA